MVFFIPVEAILVDLRRDDILEGEPNLLTLEVEVFDRPLLVKS